MIRLSCRFWGLLILSAFILHGAKAADLDVAARRYRAWWSNDSRPPRTSSTPSRSTSTRRAGCSSSRATPTSARRSTTARSTTASASSRTPTATARPTVHDVLRGDARTRWTSPSTPTARSTSPRGTRSSASATPTATARPTRRRASSSSTPRATTRTTGCPGWRSTRRATCTSAWARTSGPLQAHRLGRHARSPAAARAATSSTAPPTARSCGAWRPASGTRSASAATSSAGCSSWTTTRTRRRRAGCCTSSRAATTATSSATAAPGRHPFQAWNGELPGTLPMVAGTGESPCEVISYESDGLPAEYRGDLLVTAWADHRVERYVLRSAGASVHGGAASRSCRAGRSSGPSGLAVAPDGSLFVTDWVSRELQAARQGGGLARPLEGREARARREDPEAGVHLEAPTACGKTPAKAPRMTARGP